MTGRGPGMAVGPPRLLVPPVYLLLSLGAMALLHRFAPVSQLLEFPVRWAGAVLACASVLLVVWAAGLFERAGTPIRPFQPSTVLLTRGPYRFTRNPIYLGLVGVVTGVAILMGSLTPVFVVPAFALILHSRFVLGEERMLERTFGASYAEYRSRVRRWI